MKSLTEYSSIIEEAFDNLHLPNKPDNLYNPIRYFIKLGGKRIRPILTLLSAEMFGAQKEEALNQALAIELFHNFTLIHDDIMDQAPVRRGKATVHEKWNQTIGILSGDALLIKAYQHLGRAHDAHLKELFELFNRTASEVCEGQQMDMDFEGRMDVTVAEYVEMIRLKTSVLLGCALEMGAIVAKANDENKRKINAFGQHLGIAFQIKDDILDLYSDPSKFGKQVGGDVMANKKTILHLTAGTDASTEQRQILRQLQSLDDPLIKIGRTRDLFDHLKTKEKCEDRMKDHYKLALESLKGIDISESNKVALRNLASYLIERDI